VRRRPRRGLGKPLVRPARDRITRATTTSRDLNENSWQTACRVVFRDFNIDAGNSPADNRGLELVLGFDTCGGLAFASHVFFRLAYFMTDQEDKQHMLLSRRRRSGTADYVRFIVGDGDEITDGAMLRLLHRRAGRKMIEG
jgi:hypothetical protein